MRTPKPVVALALFLFLLPTYAQQPESPNNSVFRITSTLVQIDAVVTDSKGHQVPDLTANDFELYADGVPQPITHFSYVATSPSTQTPLPKSHANNPLLASPPTISIRREDVRRTMVLMVDDLNLSFESMASVRGSLLKFVDEQMQPGDLVAVCRTGYGTSAFQQFTSDRRLARSVINNLHWNPNSSYGISLFQPSTRDAQPFASPNQTDVVTVNANTHGQPLVLQQLDTLRRNTLAGGSLGGIDYVVQALRDMPGRKSVILFTDGISIDLADDFTVTALHRLVDRANRSATVIYTMLAAGLQTLEPNAADNPQFTQTDRGRLLAGRDVQNVLSHIDRERSEELFSAQEGLGYLSKLTGGLAYLNGNDLNFGLANVLEDQRGYYLLGYSPPSDTFNAKKGERPYHKLQVVVKYKNLHVRSRSGFYGATDEETKPHFANAVEEMQAAMLSPFTSSGVGIRLTSLYSEVPGHGPVVRSLVDIDARDLSFKPLLDGSYEAKIKLLAAAYGPDNKQMNFFGNDYSITVAPGKMEQILHDGVLYDLVIQLPKPGGFQIRAAVRDEATRKTGSANEFIDVPDARKKQLALTSVILAAASPAGTDATAIAPSAAKRQFRHGDILQYFSLLENGDPKHIAAADTSVQIRIVNDGKQIYLGPARLTDLPDHKRAAMGLLKLGDQLPTGDYFFQVVASLPNSNRKSIANQWTDFELLP